MIAACLIVKDAIETIDGCLRSIRPFVDEVNVFDTGSTDGTLELLEAAAVSAGDGGARIRIERGEWRDDFAWARQQSFEMASPEADWLYWLDADDEVVGGGALREVARAAPPDVDGFLVYYDYARDAHGNVTVESWRERLVRKTAHLHWAGVVHEVLVQQPGAPEPAFVTIPAERLRHVHRPASTRWQPLRNLAILQAEEARFAAEGRDLDRRTVYHLGAEHAWHGAFVEASEYFRAYVDSFPRDDWSDPRIHGVHRLAACLRQSRRAELAVDVEGEAFGHRPDSADLRFGLVESAAALERWDDVERYARLTSPTSTGAQPLKVKLLPLLRLAEAKIESGSSEEVQKVMARAVEAAGSSPALAATAAAVAEHLSAGNAAKAREAVHLAAAAYDPDLEAAVRGLRLAAEARLSSAPPPDPRRSPPAAG